LYSAQKLRKLDDVFVGGWLVHGPAEVRMNDISVRAGDVEEGANRMNRSKQRRGGFVILWGIYPMDSRNKNATLLQNHTIQNVGCQSHLLLASSINRHFIG
jgi:hypothetical protein